MVARFYLSPPAGLRGGGGPASQGGKRGAPWPEARRRGPLPAGTVDLDVL